MCTAQPSKSVDLNNLALSPCAGSPTAAAAESGKVASCAATPKRRHALSTMTVSLVDIWPGQSLPHPYSRQSSGFVFTSKLAHCCRFIQCNASRPTATYPVQKICYLSVRTVNLHVGSVGSPLPGHARYASGLAVRLRDD